MNATFLMEMSLLDLYRGDARRASLQVDAAVSTFAFLIINPLADCLVGYADLRLTSSAIGS